MTMHLPRRAPLTLFALAILFLSGCDLFSVKETDPFNMVTSGVYVVNQGNFSDANGSISLYDPQTKQVNASIISNTGSVLQSVGIASDRLFVLANSANRVDVYRRSDHQLMTQITGVVSPRYMIGYRNRGYVTNLSSEAGTFTGGTLTVIDLDNNSKVKVLNVGNNPEGLVITGTKMFVANHGFGAGNTLSVVDVQTETVTSTITVACDGPRHLMVDEDNDLLVFCTGNTVYATEPPFQEVSRTNGKILVLNPSTGTLVKSIDIDGQIMTEGPGLDIYYSSKERTMFAVKDKTSLVKFNTITNSVSGSVGPFDDGPIGAVAYDDLNDRLYTGHTPSYAAPGKVVVRLPDGTQESEFQVGVAPAFIGMTREYE